MNGGDTFVPCATPTDSMSYRRGTGLASIDWDHAGEQMLLHKDKWHHLGFFEQSDWKCNFFGIPKERFKMVIWK